MRIGICSFVKPEVFQKSLERQMLCFVNSPPSEKHLLDRNIQGSIPITMFFVLPLVTAPGT